MTEIKVFSTEWFKKYNKWIVRVAKIPFIGEWIFRIKKYGCAAEIKNICGMLPNAVIEERDNKKIYHFFVKNEFSIRLYNVFFPIWIIFHTWDIITRPFPRLNLGFDTFEPESGGGGTNDTCDGYSPGVTPANTWSAVRDGSGGGVTNGTNDYVIYTQAGNATNYWAIYRGFMSFDTSSLSGTISSAKLSLYVTFRAGQLTDRGSICLSQNQADFNNISSNDYYAVRNNTTRMADDFVLSTLTTSAYNDITFNSTGISNISKTGITGLLLRTKEDVDNTAPTWSSGNPLDTVRCYMSDNGTNKPQLVVTIPTAPTVTTQNASSITTTSFTGNGNITATGGANATRRGFCYKVGTSGDPTTADSVAYDDGDFGTGAFTKSITGLSAGTSYRVRAYAVNSAGTSYGATVQVETLEAFIPRTMWFN